MAVTTTGATTTSSVNTDQLARATSGKRKRRKKFIKGAIKHPGSLHRALGVPLGSRISQAQLGAALKSTSPDVRDKARFAKELAKLRK